ncbi:hypothetical protein HDV05_001394 [Chytridiales sp. JEL 0842]|nr:hypothetical protein HDV05_001394 [Chytridiales sp. JEL 0842]
MSWISLPRPHDKPIFANNVLEANCLYESIKATAVGGTAGLFLAGSEGWWFGFSRQQIARSAFTKSTLAGGLLGVYYATYCSLAHFRHKDDPLNAGAAGALVGVLFGMKSTYYDQLPVRRRTDFFITPLIGIVGSSPSKMAFFGALAGSVTAFANFAEREINSARGISKVEKQERRSEGFFQFPKRDPYAGRMAAIQAREEAAE